MVSKETCECLQWKGTNVGLDKRQGISHLLNIVSVLGVSLRSHHISKRNVDDKSVLNEENVDAIIKDARKQNAEAFRIDARMSKEEARHKKAAAVPLSLPPKNPKADYLRSLKNAIESLEKDMAAFKMPSA